jgi:hypothetical protein
MELSIVCVQTKQFLQLVDMEELIKAAHLHILAQVMVVEWLPEPVYQLKIPNLFSSTQLVSMVLVA